MKQRTSKTDKKNVKAFLDAVARSFDEDMRLRIRKILKNVRGNTFCPYDVLAKAKAQRRKQDIEWARSLDVTRVVTC